ncbi:MAG: uracil phosphoribosyltransferase [bacterium]
MNHAFKNLIIVDNPLVKRDITILRDKTTPTFEFRHSLNRIAYCLAVEISKLFKIKSVQVETPLEETEGFLIDEKIVLVPVLRAGLSLVQSFLEIIPIADVGHIGLERNEKTLEPRDYYYKTPSDLENSKVIVLDPMLATGGSADAAFTSLKKKGAKDCILACLIAAPEGVARIEREHPEIPIFTATLDRCLNNVGYILPGLGDAGDRTFGTL